jgi:hypothetical protein
VPRTRVLGEDQAVAATPLGVLLVTYDERPALSLLEPGATEPRVLVPDLAATGAAVAADGSRATVVTAGGTILQEVAVPSGRVLRTVPLGPPLLAPGESALPVDYAGYAVLLALTEQTAARTVAARTAIWKPGDDGVVGTVGGLGDSLGAAPGLFAATRSTQERRLVPERDGGCDVLVVARTGGGDVWPLCRERFVGFSPDGEHVLATNAVGDGLVVRDARDGDEVARFDELGHLMAYGWETSDTTLHTTAEDGITVIVRCSVSAERCEVAAAFPHDGRIPMPVSPP